MIFLKTLQLGNSFAISTDSQCVLRNLGVVRKFNTYQYKSKKTKTMVTNHVGKGIIAFTLLLLLSACSKSEVDLQGIVRGHIVNALNDEPIQGVAVTMSPGGKTTITGSDGFFEFTELDPGQYSLQAQKSEFKTNYKQISVMSGQVASGDLSLTPLQTTSSVEISPLSLDFGTSHTELIATIHNAGDIGTIEWTVSGISVDWLQISPLHGATGKGMTSTIRVAVFREAIPTKTATTYFTLNYPGGSASIPVSVSKAN